jgi:hypothetical protein
MLAVRRKGGGQDPATCIGRGADDLTGANTDTAVVSTSIGPGVSEAVPAGLTLPALNRIRPGQAIRRAITILARKVVRLRKTKTWTTIGAELNLTGSQLRRLFIAGGGVSTGERRVPKAKPTAPKATAAGTDVKTKATSNDEES